MDTWNCLRLLDGGLLGRLFFAAGELVPPQEDGKRPWAGPWWFVPTPQFLQRSQLQIRVPRVESYTALFNDADRGSWDGPAWT